MASARKHTDEDGFVVVDPEIMDGLPTLRGTRVPVYVILELIEEGHSFEDILLEYPFLTRDQIRAAVHYAAERVAASQASE